VSGGFLEAMAQGSRARLKQAQRTRSYLQLEQEARNLPPAPRLRLDPRGFDLIAELKLRSPAQGLLQGADEDIAARVASYAAGGAAAVSVLTEPERFDGSLKHLESAVRVLNPLQVPAMRKDFLVDPYQVLEARLAGAGGVLVILRMLSVAELGALLECARAQGLFVLLEAFDEADIELMHTLVESAAPGLQLLAGLNCRDLETLQVVPQRLLQLAARLPAAVPRVAESGVTSPAEARAVAAAHYQLALVGSALMQGAEPRALAAALLGAGRAAAQER
jgi:indole-3-glycerol phosphate synthase